MVCVGKGIQATMSKYERDSSHLIPWSLNSPVIWESEVPNSQWYQITLTGCS